VLRPVLRVPIRYRPRLRLFATLPKSRRGLSAESAKMVRCQRPQPSATLCRGRRGGEQGSLDGGVVRHVGTLSIYDRLCRFTIFGVRAGSNRSCCLSEGASGNPVSVSQGVQRSCMKLQAITLPPLTALAFFFPLDSKVRAERSGILLLLIKPYMLGDVMCERPWHMYLRPFECVCRYKSVLCRLKNR
jgi:hypothetical protein